MSCKLVHIQIASANTAVKLFIKHLIDLVASNRVYVSLTMAVSPSVMALSCVGLAATTS
jgi:hypothetical protein